MSLNGKMALYGIAVIISFLTTGCGDEAVPKPKAYLRLDYNEAEYVLYNDNCPFSFGINSQAKVNDKGECNLTLQYPKMKATVYLTYKPVNGNLEALLRDAQKLTYEHVIKADEIQEQPYINPERKVYGMFYQVGGNAATNAQFYATDSTRHFITGSMYFYAKPNFDSILPAASYIKDDMRNIIETLKWK